MIVVDVGCKSHEQERSIGPLVERFRPAILFGFDPHRMLAEGVSQVGSTVVVTRRAAAWTHDGTVLYDLDGTRSSVGGADGYQVDCFDLARWLRVLPPDEAVVVKLDIEGGEYPLLDHLQETGADELVGLFLVEWHDGARELRRPVEAWQ